MAESLVNMDGWSSFLRIIAVQAAVLLFVELLRQRRVDRGPFVHSLGKSLLAGLAMGLPFGIVFDVVISSHFGVFRYILHGLPFAILNGLLSYGLAIATALRLSPLALPAKPETRMTVWLGLAAISVLGAIATLVGTHLLIRLVGLGALIMAVGEFVEILVLGTYGPVSEALRGLLGRPLQAWALVAVVGTVYEAANFVWPVWKWASIGLGSPLVSEGIIAVFGYVVLMHACRVAGMLALRVIDHAQAQLEDRSRG